MWDRLKTGATVVIITTLIWFTADQNVSEEQTFSVPIRIVSPNANKYCAFAEAPYQATFQVSAVGRRRHLKEFGEAIASKAVLDAVLDESKETSRTPQALSGREILGMVKEVADAPVRLRNIDPPSVLVRMDEFATVTGIRVACNFGDMKVTAELAPTTLSVRLPRFAADKLQADPVARADVEQRIRSARKPDGSFQIKAPVSFDCLKELDPDMKIEVLPAPEVQISGQIDALTVTRRKGPIQITWSIPQQVQEDFKIVMDPAINLRPDIDVTGPKETVDQLDPREIRAFVDILAADTEKPHTFIRRAVQFVLPPGYSLTAGSPPYEVSFQLEPRATSANAASTP
jgi:hypothetical protein